MDTYKEKRPWGNFELLSHNKPSTVKILTVNPYSELSLQYHNHRDEFWKILKGYADVTLGKRVIKGKKNDKFIIKRKTNHRVKTYNEAVKILEISFGKFDESDIVRLEDKYNRI